MNNYRIQIKKSLDEELAKQWSELWESAENANVFNSYEWFLAALEIQKANQFVIYTCYYHDKLVAIVPLIFTKCFGVSVASPPAHKYISHIPFLIKSYDTELFRVFFSRIFNENNLYLTKLDQKSAEIFRIIFPHLLLPIISVNPCIDIQYNPLRFLSGSTLKKMQNIANNNSKRLKFKEFDNQHDLEKSLEIMFAIDQKSGKHEHSKDIFSKLEKREAFKKIVRHCGRFVRICFLFYDNLPIAYSFDLACKKVYIGYQTSYLYKYRKLSPGKSVAFHLIKSLMNSSVQTFDLGGGLSNYKREFTPNFYLKYNLYYSKNLFIMWWWNFINLVRRKKQEFFPKQFTNDHMFLFKTVISPNQK